MSDKIYNWICRTCCCEFSSRRKLAQHYKDLPEHYKKHSSANKSELKKCKFCGKEWVCTNTGLKLHEKCCLDNPNRKRKLLKWMVDFIKFPNIKKIVIDEKMNY